MNLEELKRSERELKRLGKQADRGLVLFWLIIPFSIFLAVAFGIMTGVI